MYVLEERNINPFWNDVLKANGSLNDAYIPLTPEELLAEPIFFNKKFKIDKKAIFFPEWTVAGVYAVGALVKTDGSFKSLNEFKTEFNMNTKMLDYFGCLNVIKRFARKYSINIKSNQSKKQPKVVSLLTGALKGAKPIYNTFLGEGQKPKACEKWENILGKEMDWNAIFLRVNNIKEIKLKWFQIKICHRILVTTSILLQMNITDSNKCNFCSIEKDTILHYLWECRYTQKFWNDFLGLIKD